MKMLIIQIFTITLMIQFIYNAASTPSLALSQLQLAFNIGQRNLFNIKLVLKQNI